jgi:hypothetical protein
MNAEIVDLNGSEATGVAEVIPRIKERRNTHFPRTRSVRGTPDIKATSFLFDETRTPMCHSLWYPGGFRALCIQ